jgi:hypothetical protein
MSKSWIGQVNVRGDVEGKGGGDTTQTACQLWLVPIISCPDDSSGRAATKRVEAAAKMRAISCISGGFRRS